MDEAMPYHLIFSLEPLSALSPRTAFDGAVMRSALRVNICVRAIDVVSNQRLRDFIVSLQGQ
jgi:hypothetical protein